MSFNEVDRAQVLAEALPYIQKYSGKTIVVKYGGNAMVSDQLRHAVISDIILLSLVGIRRPPFMLSLPLGNIPSRPFSLIWVRTLPRRPAR